MQQVETALRILAAQADVADVERFRDHACEVIGGSFGDCGFFPGQRAGQGQVKLKLFHHIGIAVGRQQIALARGQAFWVAAGDLGWRQGGAVGVEATDHFGGQRLQRAGVAQGGEREEAFEVGHLKPRHFQRRKAGGQTSRGLRQIFGRGAFGCARSLAGFAGFFARNLDRDPDWLLPVTGRCW